MNLTRALLLHDSSQTKWRRAIRFVFDVKKHSALFELAKAMNLNSVDKRWWQSLLSLQSFNSYKTASIQHQRAMFWAFSDQQSIGLSVESIDSSHRQILSRQQPRFPKAILKLHQSSYFQQQALSVIESISSCTFNLICNWPARRKCRRVNESESDEECHCLDWSWSFNTDVSETFSQS